MLPFFGNNSWGRAGIPQVLGGRVHLGFPAVGGRLVGDVAEYAVIRQQPTALEASSGPTLAEFTRAPRLRGLAVQRVADMSGWLAYHAVFVTSVCPALYRHGTDPHRLAGDRPTLALMCTAISDGFAVLRKRGVRGAPRNLSLLQARNAEREMPALAGDLVLDGEPVSLARLLAAPAAANLGVS